MSGFDLGAIVFNPEFAAIFAQGVAITFVVAIGSWALAMALGIALLVIRLSPSRIADGAVAAYVSYHRNVPTLVQLMLWYFGISALLPGALQAWLGEHHGEIIFAIIALGLCQAAYFSEDLRSGFRSVALGQSDAARALGHGHLGAMRFVIMPQAVRNAMPALVNHTVSLFKNSSLAMAVGVAELTQATMEIESTSFRTFETYLVATIIYLACSLVLMAGGALVSRRGATAGAW
jgi:polar amino acid transport system permease protein